ncbi:hypothetical protein RF11_02587 [Thelohanellus kitauei]|uniref:Uncharacterized protein n=1 Tax=Thelohanellus kitauei TaxID=669202 RepID=A0A0C2J7H7_THEKT|nr:hypothetical protein RF11_02587 [Thelohanellus kitauei]
MDTNPPTCEPQIVAFFKLHQNQSQIVALLKYVHINDIYVMIIMRATFYIIMMIKFAVLISFMVKRTEILMVSTGIMHMISCNFDFDLVSMNALIMVCYIILIKDFYSISALTSEKYQDTCDAPYTSFITFWPIAMMMLSLVEVTIFVSFHLSITIIPFKIETWVEGDVPQNTKCTVLNDILRQKNKNGLDQDKIAPSH